MDIGEGQIRSVYCHWDGYPTGVGAALIAGFTTEEAVKALIDLGDLSTVVNHVVSYHASRGEAWESVQPKVHGYRGAPREEWFYLWRDGEWWVSDHGKGPSTLHRLADVLAANRGDGE